MEGFSMPQSNKRTASLPSPHPVGLQSCCSAPLGSPPLRLHQATALCWTHAQQDPCLSGHMGSTHHRDNHLSAVPVSSPEPDPHHDGIPAHKPCCQIQDHQDTHSLASPNPSSEPIPRLAGMPRPPAHHRSGPAEPQLRVE
jgi:hypothetical protein